MDGELEQDQVESEKRRMRMGIEGETTKMKGCLGIVCKLNIFEASQNIYVGEGNLYEFTK